MRYLSILLFAVILIPVTQAAHAQNILDQIGKAFQNITGQNHGGSNQTSSQGGSSGAAGQSSSSNQTSSQGTVKAGNMQQLQSVGVGNNSNIMKNNTPISNPNASTAASKLSSVTNGTNTSGNSSK